MNNAGGLLEGWSTQVPNEAIDEIKHLKKQIASLESQVDVTNEKLLNAEIKIFNLCKTTREVKRVLKEQKSNLKDYIPYFYVSSMHNTAREFERAVDELSFILSCIDDTLDIISTNPKDSNLILDGITYINKEHE